jgi:hypothetical protein
MATSAISEDERRWLADSSLWSLVAANALVLALALYQHWSFGSLLLLYWAQSVVIGVANVFRILGLERFSTEGYTVNGRPVEATPETQRRTALFFAVHYGLFHAVYLAFIIGLLRRQPLWTWTIALGTALFVLNHVWSYRRNRDLDRQGKPNIGALMFFPYIRIVPMHAIILSGALFAPTAFGIALFAVLKTAADVAMQVVEHRLLRKAAPAVPLAGVAADAAPLRAPPRS